MEQQETEYQPASGLMAVFSAAYNGLLHTVSVQRNMKVHWVSGFMVMLVGMALELDLGARAALFFSVFLILFSEILNSALEAFVDLHIKVYAYQAKLAKDAAAAGVLILAAAVVILFCDMIWTYRGLVLDSGPAIARSVGFGLPATVLLVWSLFFSTPAWLKWAQLLVIFLLLTPLLRESRDEFFTFGAYAFVAVGIHARMRFPEGNR